MDGNFQHEFALVFMETCFCSMKQDLILQVTDTHSDLSALDRTRHEIHLTDRCDQWSSNQTLPN